MDIKSIESLVVLATEQNKKISDIVIDIEARSEKIDRQVIIDKMSSYYDIMRESVENGKKEKFNFVTGLQNECVEIVEKFYKVGSGYDYSIYAYPSAAAANTEFVFESELQSAQTVGLNASVY